MKILVIVLINTPSRIHHSHHWGSVATGGGESNLKVGETKMHEPILECSHRMLSLTLVRRPEHQPCASVYVPLSQKDPRVAHDSPSRPHSPFYLRGRAN